ncbi:amidase family protein [uncultured Christiangramia sp.]|uniref:amidase family protein n=1 Tax=uncultured Christiangramia sp. TaxID=503836 RepID=UPI00262B0615|nr:amidase family protein [uncultured Christiangramia sp.]
MKQLFLLFVLAILLTSCKNDPENSEAIQTEQDSTSVSSEEREFKVLDSEFITADSLWVPFEKDLDEFTSEVYEEVKALVFEKSIPEIQESIASGKLTYEELSLFYLTRIREYDRENELSLNSVISLNPDLIAEARKKDEQLKNSTNNHPIYGIPVLLKDNINTKAMPTTAGAEALKGNQTGDAFIVERLKKNGALILGKANLSEWAYFFCGECPSGYSAVGGQTLNPYGRKIHDTGGSSSGSGVAVAANLAPVAVGSETSGSILSPSSSNSIVGMKPTIGLLSRGGIVPISSTLDTPGPMTRSVIDNAILLSAMTGVDSEDPASSEAKQPSNLYKGLKNSTLKGKRFGVIKSLKSDSLYLRAVADLEKAGATIIEYEAEEINLPNFLRLLNLDMQNDLPEYFQKYGGDVDFQNVQDVVDYNAMDSVKRAPYGQALFLGILKDSASTEEFAAIKDTLKINGTRFLSKPMKEHDLDAIISINNYHAGYAAVAKYPAITVPMGYTSENQPMGLTFISEPFSEKQLLEFAYAFEKTSKRRKTPKDYNE